MKLYMKIDSFLKDFKNTEAYARLTANPEAIMIYLGGSRIAQLHSELSDYDICSLVRTYRKEIDWSKILRLEKDDKHLHVYQDVLENFLTITNWGNAVGMMHFHYLEPDDILYINPKFEGLYNRLLSSRKDISTLGCYMLVEVFYKYLDQCLHSANGAHIKPTKRLYHLCVAASILLGSPLDTPLILKVKKCKKIPLTQEDEIKLLNILKALWDFVHCHPLSVRETGVNLLNSLLEEV